MATSSRPDSPLESSFTRKLSDPTASLGCIAEQPKNPQTPVRGRSRRSALRNLHHQYTCSCGPRATSLSSHSTSSTIRPNPSATSSSSSTTALAPSHPYQPRSLNSNSSTPPTANQHNDGNYDNWNDGWSISRFDKMIDSVSSKRDSLPYIAENDFLYYPKVKQEVQSCWSADEEEKDGRVKMKGRKLERGERNGEGLRKRLRRIMRKLNCRR
ncbi:hypothetical protein FB567DRAFT_577927 [Paraphoma chrysanthemicola]|uniref:Uncharacterized protein n=1 Tax=Paraphoma chrysanthemicola TaxID=798071 RepID=A0A8K0RB11_9PLEO|nr:hypothetical protein FB567DRAFT_577927 [Paraphoma chrysanthemicola]